MMSYVVCDSVSEDDGQFVITGAEVEETAVDEDFATG